MKGQGTKKQRAKILFFLERKRYHQKAALKFLSMIDPIKDAKTGRNLIPLMVHSKRSKNYDFEGVFCVVLKLK